MPVQSYNLQFTLAKAENAQAFQNQYLIQDRLLLLHAQEAHRDDVVLSGQQIRETPTLENRTVDPDKKRESTQSFRRRDRRDSNPFERDTVRPPLGDGSLLDITI
ncbi:MAG: hypothetical protein QF752_16965 [Planctomycetota bacterium]|jgi:hypothetical protein|nr:hypothetical protein [Planctomycetota bacterium]